MNLRAPMAVAGLLATLALSGCGQQEREELRGKVANLEQQLAKVTTEMANKENALRELAEKSDQQAKKAEADIAAATAEMERLKADLTKCQAAKPAPKKKK